MIALIVNADDLGLSAERDRGIFAAFGRGIVTSATLIANGPSFAGAVEQAHSDGLPVGIHLNLSDGLPLTGPIGGLTGPCGRFPGKQLMRQALLHGDCDLPAIRRELQAQIDKVVATGLEPTHIDGHQHCHIYSRLIALVIDLARANGITALRSSRPADPAEVEISEELREDLRLFRRLGSSAHGVFRAAGLRTPDGLWGLPLLHTLDTARLSSLLTRLDQGFWELMTHPGHPTPSGRPFEGEQRQVELEALTSREVRQVVEARGIRLCSYRELPCAC